MKTNTIDTDEYTALQKYISTYRDPKAIDAEANAAADGKDAGKGKAWWQVCSQTHHIAASHHQQY